MKRWSNSLNAILAARLLVPILILALKAPLLWQAEWSHDDLMNCYRILDTPWSSILRDIVCFWQPTQLFRPLGEAFYKLFWPLFGFEPLPWRLASGAVLVANAVLLGQLAQRLSNSPMAGLAATAVAAYHPGWTHLYLNTGTIFELLAFSFVFLGLLVHLEFSRPWLTTLILILGLNSKESAIVLPVLVLLYELIWHRRIPWLFCGLATAVSLAFIFGRVLGEGGIARIGDYQPTYSFATYLTSFQSYFGFMVGLPALFLLLPLVARNRLAVFAVLVFPIGILPLAFVLARGLEGVYIACASLGLAAAAVVARWPRAVFGLPLLLLLPAQPKTPGWEKDFVEIRQFRQSLEAELGSLPRGSHLRFHNEPFGEEYPWASTFIPRLLYRDTSIRVNQPGEADAEFEWRVDRLYRIK